MLTLDGRDEMAKRTHKTDLTAIDREMSDVVVLAGTTLAIALIALGLFSHSLALCALSFGSIELAAVNCLHLSTYRRSRRTRRRLGSLLQLTLLPPVVAGGWILLTRSRADVPGGITMAAVAMSALACRAFTAAILLTARRPPGTQPSITLLVGIRRDAVAAVAVFVGGIATLALVSPWPDAVIAAALLVLHAKTPRSILKEAESRRWLSAEDWLDVTRHGSQAKLGPGT